MDSSVHKTILDTMLYSKENRNFGICIKIVLNIQFLTFCGGAKMKKELSQRDLALSLCCLGRIRTLTGGTRIRRATITPQGIVFLLLRCKVMHFFRICQIFFRLFYYKIVHQILFYYISIIYILRKFLLSHIAMKYCLQRDSTPFKKR